MWCQRTLRILCSLSLVWVFGEGVKSARGAIAIPAAGTSLETAGILQKVPHYLEKGPGVQGKRWPKFFALRLGVVFLLS